MSVRRSLERARVGIILPVLATTVGTVAVASGVEGTTYIRAAAGVLERALQPNSSIRYTDSALPSPPVFALPRLNSISKVIEDNSSARPGEAGTLLNAHSLQHPRVQQWVERLTTTSKRDYQSSLGRMSKFEDMIASKLAARKMPQELIYLPMIESNFNPNAQSPAKAVGLWQFMSATARRFGLTVRGRVDERRDPERATDAALKYLSSLYDRFGSWYLAAAAYNSGEGTVLRALRSVTGRPVGTDADFFRILPKLPRETQDYVPKLIASAHVGQAPERYGIAVQPAANVLTRTPVTRHRSLTARRPAKRMTEARSSVARRPAAKSSRSLERKRATAQRAKTLSHRATTMVRSSNSTATSHRRSTRRSR